MNNADISKYFGTYRGVTPSDASHVGMGEIEVSFSEDKVAIQIATGSRVDSEEIPIAEVAPLPREEISMLYAPGSIYPARTDGFKLSNGVTFMFLRDPSDEEYGLVVRGTLGDLLGPTILFSPKQQERGLFPKLLRHIKDVRGHELPQIKNGGK